MEWLEVQRGQLFHECHPRKSQTPLHSEPLWRECGGPILHDKLFFFFDSEWVRIALSIVTAATIPTSAFQSYVLQQLALGGIDSVSGSVYQPSPQSVPFYQKMFSLYGNTNGTPLTVLGCPFDVGGGPPLRMNVTQPGTVGEPESQHQYPVSRFRREPLCRGSRRLAKQSGLWLTGKHDRSFSLFSERSATNS